MSLSRRAFNRFGLAAAAGVALPRLLRGQPATQPASKPWLLFTKSAGFIHDTIKRNGEAPSFLAAHLQPLFESRGLNLIESKDGRLFDPDRIGDYGGFVFYTTGDLTTPGNDGQPPMSPDGKSALLRAIEAGTPFIGLHCASDTFPDPSDAETGDYLRMLGGCFDRHGEQQRSTARIVDPTFPGVGRPEDWTFTEEWYALKKLGSDLHPIHVLETADMKGEMYQREPFPITWTRTHGRGRVFYTALGHREDVIAGNPWQVLIGGAIDWCCGD